MGFRIASDPDHGAPVLGPPANWRPRSLTIKEKLEIVVRQGGREPGGERLLPMMEGVEFDHQPALQRRRWIPEIQDTMPGSCDLNYIVALNKGTHGVKTAKVDQREIAKTKRLEGRTGQGKPKRRWPSKQIANGKRRFG